MKPPVGSSPVRTSDFDFQLPPELIAQRPAPQRDQSRLMVVRREDGIFAHQRFIDLPEFVRADDVLVLNNSRVIPARLRGINEKSGGEFELLLLEEAGADVNEWWAMVRPGKRARLNARMALRNRRGESTGVIATVIGQNSEGHRRLRFSGAPDIPVLLDSLGEVPLPPYIRRSATEDLDEDVRRYQTIYARADAAGSVAAPTAGLHFTASLLDTIRARGAQTCFVTLHVGLGTFAPVKAETLERHVMHEERYQVGAETARIVNEARRDGRRIIAVGTTSVRVLESVAAQNEGQLVPGAGRTRIFIHPPHEFLLVDALLTNFHLPQSTLLMLVSALADPKGLGGRQLLLSAYAEAIRERYRFFSYGDAMLLV